MDDIESSDLQRDVESSMRMFEKSKVGPAPLMDPITPTRVLLVLDGSPQDNTGVNAAIDLQQRFDTQTFVLDARDDGNDGTAESTDVAAREDLATQRATEINKAQPIQRSEGEAYEAILEAAKSLNVDLVILPCPFGRSFEKVGADSAGTVIDVMLSRCPQPMLVIRRDDQTLPECTQQIAVIMGAESDASTRAAASAFGIAAPDATVTLNLVVEREEYENIRSIIEAIQPGTDLEPEQFAEALTKAHQSLHASMTKTASSLGFNYALRPLAGEVAPPNPLQESKKMLLVMPLEVDDRFIQGFVQDRIRRSPHPVLVVPGNVPTDG